MDEKKAAEFDAYREQAAQVFGNEADDIPGGIATFLASPGKIAVRYFNDAFCALSGRTADEFLSDSASSFYPLIHPDDRLTLKKRIDDCVINGYRLDNLVFRCLHRDDTVSWVRAVVSDPHVTEEGKLYLVIFSDATREKDAERLLKSRSEHDALTGIFNREAFISETAKLLAIDKDRNYVLAVCDVDKFRIINDLFGTKTGDKVLCAIASELDQFLSGIGVFGRMEADHFAFCLPAKLAVAEELTDRFDRTLSHLDVNCKITVRFGMCEITDRSAPIEKLYDAASLALQSIKGKYFKRSAWYDDNMRKKMVDEQKLISSMDSALIKGQFKVYFQPIISTRNMQTIGAEALVRWYNPQSGVMRPDSFIPLFERSGFITKLDAYVWEEACRFLAHLDGTEFSDIYVSVNMSRLDIYKTTICKEIAALADKYHVKHSKLKFEITESAYTDNAPQLSQTIKELQSIGFNVMMDDFGSGYSSLTMLKDLPFDALKLDRDFIANSEQSEKGNFVMSSMVRLARRLGIPTIAEGVETREQYRFLTNIGCDAIQGFYFAKPMPENEFDNYLIRPVCETTSRAGSRGRKNQYGIPANGKSTLLIVDDSKINRAMLTKTLEADYNFVEAENGRKALDILDEGKVRIDLVVLDIIMPVMNGYDFLEAVRGDKRFASLPVIVTTESSDKNSETMALSYGANDFVSKPFDPLIIRLRIGNLARLSEEKKRNDTVEMLLRRFPEDVVVFEPGDGGSAMITYISGSAAEKLGCSAREFTDKYSQEWLSFISPDRRGGMIAALNTFNSGENTGHTDTDILMPDGSMQECSIDLYREDDGNGGKLCYAILSGGEPDLPTAP